MKVIFTFENPWSSGRFNIIIYIRSWLKVLCFTPFKMTATALIFARGSNIYMCQRNPNAEIVRGNTYIIKYIIKQRLFENISTNLENDCVLWTIFPTMKSCTFDGTYIDLNTKFDTAGRNVVEYYGIYIYIYTPWWNRL